jgi:hypothetical protein
MQYIPLLSYLVGYFALSDRHVAQLCIHWPSLLVVLCKADRQAMAFIYRGSFGISPGVVFEDSTQVNHWIQQPLAGSRASLEIWNEHILKLETLREAQLNVKKNWGFQPTYQVQEAGDRSDALPASGFTFVDYPIHGTQLIHEHIIRGLPTIWNSP